MAERNGRDLADVAQAVLLDDPGFLRGIVERALQAILEEEMTAHLGAARYERGRGADRAPQRLQAAHPDDPGRDA